VETAVAVYSGVDVVGVLQGRREEIDSAYEKFYSGDAPIESVDRFPADEVVLGSSFGNRRRLARNACLAFVRSTIRIPDVGMAYAISALRGLAGVVRLFPNAEKGEIVLEVVADGKQAFDHVVMEEIQGKASVVRATRTYPVINNMRWRQDSSDTEPQIFISVAESDIAFARSLCQRIESECGVRCWTYEAIPVASKSWSDSVDEAIHEAQCHIFVTSKSSLESTECAREFGLADAISDPEDICCLVLSDCEISDLPVRHQQRQCLLANDFFGYPHLIDWLLDRGETPHSELPQVAST
jgi:hypothetical protein